jgi:hypothetical protein
MQQNSIDTARLRPALRDRMRRVESLAERSFARQHIEYDSQHVAPLVEDRKRRAAR